jgi:hypothetical protein
LEKLMVQRASPKTNRSGARSSVKFETF